MKKLREGVKYQKPIICIILLSFEVDSIINNVGSKQIMHALKPIYLCLVINQLETNITNKKYRFEKFYRRLRSSQIKFMILVVGVYRQGYTKNSKAILIMWQAQ